MKLFIEASNLAPNGGGVVHLTELLSNIDPNNWGFTEVHVFAPRNILIQIQDKEWLIKRSHVAMDGGLKRRLYWILWKFPAILRTEKPNVLFLPGGNYIKYSPSVSMSQNLLPFDRKTISLFSFRKRIKFTVLRKYQLKAFKYADTIIFLTEFSKLQVQKYDQTISAKGIIIPHGVNKIFTGIYHRYDINKTSPVKILYVSSILPYKHQLTISKAVIELYKEGFNIELQLIGHSDKDGQKVLNQISALNREYSIIHHIPEIPNKELVSYYQNSDIFIFGSSCETFGIIILEAMSSGLPIACANQASLKETLGDAGIFFDPKDYLSIKQALYKYLTDEELRVRNSKAAITRSKNYNWEKTANATFELLNKVATEKDNK